MKRWRIKVLTGACKGQYLPMEPGLTLGRKRANLNLNDPKASSIHAIIKKTRTGKIVLVDNDSRNGTKVQGKRRKKIILVPGVTFQIGSTAMEIIDFDKYVSQKAQDVAHERARTSSFDRDMTGEQIVSELRFGSTDPEAHSFSQTEDETPGDFDVNVSSGRVNEDDIPTEMDQPPQDPKVSAAPKLNIKKYEEKESFVDELQTDSEPASELPDLSFSETPEPPEKTDDTPLSDLLASDPEIDVNISGKMNDELTPAQLLENTKFHEMAEGTPNENAGNDPFGDLEKDLDPQETSHEEILATVATANHPDQTQAINPTPASDTVPLYAGDKTQAINPQTKTLEVPKLDSLDRALEEAGEVAKNSVKSLQPFVPGVRLVFTRGPQMNTSWTLGYGPRDIGPESSEFPIFENGTPDICFSLHPTNKGVMFKTEHPEIVKLNDKPISSDVLADGDTIKIGDSAIEVETF